MPAPCRAPVCPMDLLSQKDKGAAAASVPVGELESVAVSHGYPRNRLFSSVLFPTLGRAGAGTGFVPGLTQDLWLEGNEEQEGRMLETLWLRGSEGVTLQAEASPCSTSTSSRLRVDVRHLQPTHTGWPRTSPPWAQAEGETLPLQWCNPEITPEDARPDTTLQADSRFGG